MQVTFDINSELMSELKKKAGGNYSEAELINNGLTLLQWAIEQKELGRDLAVLDTEAKNFSVDNPLQQFLEKKMAAPLSELINAKTEK